MSYRKRKPTSSGYESDRRIQKRREVVEKLPKTRPSISLEGAKGRGRMLFIWLGWLWLRFRLWLWTTGSVVGSASHIHHGFELLEDHRGKAGRRVNWRPIYSGMEKLSHCRARRTSTRAAHFSNQPRCHTKGTRSCARSDARRTGKGSLCGFFDPRSLECRRFFDGWNKGRRLFGVQCSSG